MAKYSRNQLGFEAVGILVAILLFAVIGFVGYKVFTMNKTAYTATTTQQGADESGAQGLEGTDKELDASGQELDSNLDDGTLDADIDAML